MTHSITEKTGILGGTFDPVHAGHLALARDILDQMNLDRIWFVPAWQSPHKQDQNPAEASHRLNMLQEALAPFEKLQVSEIELEQKEISYTINTLTALQSRHPKNEWVLILGMDTFREFPSWKNAGEILRKAHLAVAARPGYPDTLIPDILQTLTHELNLSYQWDHTRRGVRNYFCSESGRSLSVCEVEPFDISSSELRKRLLHNQPVKKMLPPEVERYIMAHRLYQENPQPQPE